MEIKKEEFATVAENLKKYPIFEKTLTEDWIKNNIMNNEQRENKHLLFWELLLSDRIENLSEILTTLENEPYFSSIISKLKKFRDKDNFQSLITELKVLYFYKKRESDNFRVKEYEPIVPDKKKKKNDILLEIGGEDYYIEIFTLMEDKIERRNKELEQKIINDLNKLSGNPFIITYQYLETFLEEDINDFIEFTKDKIEFAKEDKQEYFEFDFIKEDTKKAVLKLYDKDLEKGFVGAYTTYARKIENDKRLKSKILDKIDEQLSDKTKNILAVNLMVPMSGLDDFFNAVFGKEVCRVNIETGETRMDREKNGVIHDPRAKKVSALIGFERGNYENREKIFMIGANNEIKEKYYNLI